MFSHLWHNEVGREQESEDMKPVPSRDFCGRASTEPPLQEFPCIEDLFPIIDLLAEILADKHWKDFLRTGRSPYAGRDESEAPHG